MCYNDSMSMYSTSSETWVTVSPRTPVCYLIPSWSHSRNIIQYYVLYLYQDSSEMKVSSFTNFMVFW